MIINHNTANDLMITNNITNMQGYLKKEEGPKCPF